MKAFLLAAGMGTRLRPLTNKKPKVMVKIGGKPVLEHLVNLCIHHKIKDIIINVYHLPEIIINYFGDGKKFRANITYIHSFLGSAGVLKDAENLLKKDAFIVMSGDAMTNLNLTKMIDFHKKKGGLATFLVHDTDHPYDSDLVEFDKKFLIKRFFRPKKGDKFRPLSKSGTHIFEPEVLNFIPKGKEYFIEKPLIPNLLKMGKKLYAFYSNDYSKDMGTPGRLAQVRKDYEEGKIFF